MNDRALQFEFPVIVRGVVQKHQGWIVVLRWGIAWRDGTVVRRFLSGKQAAFHIGPWFVRGVRL